MTDNAKLILKEKEVELPVVESVEGEKAIDITKLRSETGYITIDPGFANTGSCKSTITYINGEEGRLCYRGIPIEQFDTERPNFIEVAWLLIFGKLPTEDELLGFRNMLTENAHLHEAMKLHFEGFPVTAPPMAILSAMINTLSCFEARFREIDEDAVFAQAAASLISKIRTIAAYSYRSSRGLPFTYPDPKLRYCANFLHMMFTMPYDQYEIDPEIEDALNLILILHADHEQNCSTSTVRVVGSSQANLYASCAAGVCALWGRLHGGANVKVIEMLEQIHKGSMKPEDCIKLAKDKDSGFRLMGFGHRVYKNYDPRAKILKKACDRILSKMKIKDPMIDLAKELEEKALSDSYFIERKLYPNVDFYSGIIMRAVGIPTNMFTVLFAIGRLPGWIAHWKEQYDEQTSRISRPRQIYIGETNKEYIPLEKR